MVWVLLAAAGWSASGVLAVGYDFAHFQRKYPELAKKDFRGDQTMSLLKGLLGPIALLVIFLRGYNKYGWKWPGQPPV